MSSPLCCTRDRLLKFQLSNDQKPQEPKAWTPLVLRVWDFRHDTTLSCLVFSVKTKEKMTPLESPCSWSRSNIFTTSFISTVHNFWYWWLKNPKKPCLTGTPSFDFAETCCWATSFPGSLFFPPQRERERPWVKLVTWHPKSGCLTQLAVREG